MKHSRKSRRAHATGPVRAALGELGRGPRKRLGQHFLANPETARRIVGLAQLRGGEPVIEIGPGLGALTDPLAALAGELWLIELDADFAARLREKWSENAQVHVVEADVLQLDVPALLGSTAPAVVVANLPYNVGTAIIAHLLHTPRAFTRLVVMLQREVAERLRAVPGSKAYSGLSVLTQAVARVERGLRLPPGAFIPPPKVDSEVVIISPYAQPPVHIDNFATFAHVVRSVFSQRRKQLLNSTRSLCADARGLLEAAGIEPQRRPETLSVAEFAKLSAVLNSHRS